MANNAVVLHSNGFNFMQTMVFSTLYLFQLEKYKAHPHECVRYIHSFFGLHNFSAMAHFAVFGFLFFVPILCRRCSIQNALITEVAGLA